MSTGLTSTFKWTDPKYFSKRELLDLQAEYRAQEKASNRAYAVASLALVFVTPNWLNVTLGLVASLIGVEISDNFITLDNQLDNIFANNSIESGLYLRFYCEVKRYYNPDGSIWKESVSIRKVAIA